MNEFRNRTQNWRALSRDDIDMAALLCIASGCSPAIIWKNMEKNQLNECYARSVVYLSDILWQTKKSLRGFRVNNNRILWKNTTDMKFISDGTKLQLNGMSISINQCNEIQGRVSSTYQRGCERWHSCCWRLMDCMCTDPNLMTSLAEWADKMSLCLPSRW